LLAAGLPLRRGALMPTAPLAASVLACTLGLFALGGLMTARALRGRPPALRRARWRKFLVFLAIVHGVLAACAAGRVAVAALATAIVATAGVEVWLAWQRTRPVPAIALALPGALAAAFVASAWLLAPSRVAWIFLCCAAFDGFSQASGQLLGRHALAPAISPRKTVEGLAGGLVGAGAIGIAVRALCGWSWVAAAACAVPVAAAALAGDLGASWFKRRCAITDYSRLLPGHGGVLDRFNSFIVALALAGPWLPQATA